MKNIPALHLISVLGVLTLTPSPLLAQETKKAAIDQQSSFQKDRAAILAMAGEFKVTFNFHETHSLHKGYQIRPKAYKATAYEMVKVVEDTGRRIVLQHLLQVDDGSEVAVVKHWGQVWTYEDLNTLDYQQGTTWKNKKHRAANVKGMWTQYVTQVDDSPRYESHGKWNHSGKTSTWVSQETARPLPRREYSKRKDYDVIMGINTHTITPNGWVHIQANRKLVKRDGQQPHYLCAERGFNTYERIKGHDFSVAKNYWKKTSGFWENVRAFWNDATVKQPVFHYQKKINNVSMYKALRRITPDGEDDKAPTKEEIKKTFLPYLTQQQSGS